MMDAPRIRQLVRLGTLVGTYSFFGQTVVLSLIYLFIFVVINTSLSDVLDECHTL